jgi:alcohol dehydrogenase (cytochrome c)
LKTNPPGRCESTTEFLLNCISAAFLLTVNPPNPATKAGVATAGKWAAPSYSPTTGLFYVAHWENSGIIATNKRQTTMGDVALEPFFNNDEEARGVIRAYNPHTLEPVWAFELGNITWGGVLSTDGNLVFGGNKDGYFVALDARTGKLLWKASLGGQVNSGPMSYSVDVKQYVAAGSGLFVFKSSEE